MKNEKAMNFLLPLDNKESINSSKIKKFKKKQKNLDN